MDRDYQYLERRQTTRSPLSTLVELVYPTNFDTVDEAVASEDTEHAHTAGHNAKDHTSTLIHSDLARDSGDEADTEKVTAFDGDNDDEDPYRDIVPQNAASDSDCTLRLSGWQLGDMVRRSDTVVLPGKRGRDSDGENDGCWSGTQGERWARKRRRGEY